MRDLAGRMPDAFEQDGEEKAPAAFARLIEGRDEAAIDALCDRLERDYPRSK